MLIMCMIMMLTTTTMTIKNYSLLLLGFFFLITSCQESETEFKTVAYQDSFTIDIPIYMVEMDLENPEASIQFGNDLESHYMVVIRESHEKLAGFGIEMDIQAYADLMINYAEISIGSAKVEKMTKGIETINDMQSIGYEIEGLDNKGRPIYYQIMYLRSERALYSVTTWCDGSRKESCAPVMTEMLRSIKEN